MKVVFIASWSRSGSTLLDLLLGRVPGFVSAGELRYLWDRGMLEDQLCGCGRPFSRCPHWRRVVEEAFGATEWPDASHVLTMRRALEGIAAVPLLVWPWKPHRFARRLHAYRALLQQLYPTLASVSGASVVVDSSKDAAHGLILAGVPGIELHVVHLVRDSRAVAWSWRRKKALPEVHWKRTFMPVFPAWKSALYWTLENAAIHLLPRVAHRYVRLRYEDLVREPARELRRVLDAIDEPAVSLDFLRDGEVELAENHTVAGNPMRFRRGSVGIRADAEWETQMPAGARAVVTSLSWPLLLRYGFLKHAARAARRMP